MVFRISRAIIRLVLRAIFGFRVEGGHHEPRTGALLIVSNHVSDLDPLVVGSAIRRPVHYMAKEELFRPPLLRWWITHCGAFSVRRGVGAPIRGGADGRPLGSGHIGRDQVDALGRRFMDVIARLLGVAGPA